MDAIKVGANIKSYLDSKGISQSELADRLGVNRSSVSQWITGKMLPRIEKINEMAKMFGCTATDILEGKEEAIKRYDISVDEYAVLMEYRGLEDTQKKEFLRLMAYVRGMMK